MKNFTVLIILITVFRAQMFCQSCLPHGIISTNLFGQNKTPVNQISYNSPGSNAERLKLFGARDYFERHSYPNNDKRSFRRLSENELDLVVKQCLDSAIIGYIDYYTGDWEPDYKFQFIYDSIENMKSEIDYTWDQNLSLWYYDWKIDYSYDSSGNISGKIGYYLVDSIALWVYDMKVDYSYDDSGNRIQEIFYFWNDTISQWKEFDKREYNYDSTGILSEEYYYKWDGSSGQWISKSKYEYSYDSIGLLNQKMLYHLIDSISQWDYSLKFIYTYDESGDMIQEVEYDWRGNFWQWEEQNREDYTYDSLRNQVQTTYYFWDLYYEEWQQNWKSEYSYNNDFSIEDLILPNYLYDDGSAELLFRHKLTEINMFGWNNEWHLQQRNAFFYSDYGTTGISEIDEKGSRIYPNPADEFIQIDPDKSLNHATFVMYDLQGRKVLEKGISDNSQISVGHLLSGLYIYHLIRDNEVQSGKIIIR